MAFDYTKLAATALSLVTKFGRQVTIVKFAETAADANKPWRGNLTPRETPLASGSVYMVFVEPSSAEELGLSIQKFGMTDRQAQIAIMAPGTDTTEYEHYDEVVDGTVRWKITEVEVLKPGPLRMIYFFRVER